VRAHVCIYLPACVGSESDRSLDFKFKAVYRRFECPVRVAWVMLVWRFLGWYQVDLA